MTKLRISINKEGKIKLILTTLLFACSAVVTVISQWVYLVILPMFASTIGDISIMTSRGCCTGKKENTFEFGIIAFGAAHLLYIAMMQTQYSLKILLIAFILYAITVCLAINKKRTAASVFYAMIIILNFINSIFFHPLAMIGMILFIISDIILAIFEDKDPRAQIAIWFFYVTGQLCIITSFLLILI